MKLPQLSRIPRHTIEKTDDSLIITIKSHRNIFVLLFTTIWLFMMTYMLFATILLWSGIFIAMTGLGDAEINASPVYLVPFCVSSIFPLIAGGLELYGVYAFLTELAGKELIIISKDKTSVVKQLFRWKREKEFSSEMLKELIIRNTSQRSSWNPLKKRYRQAFELDHDGKTYRFGFLVKEEEAKEILSAIHAFISPAM